MVWAQSPKVFLALSALFGVLDRQSSSLSPALRSLIIVRVSQLNGCSFCIDLNSNVLFSRGVSVVKVLDLSRWTTSEHFTNHEKMVLEYVEAVTYSKQEIDQRIRERLKVYFTETEIVEITALIAFQNMSTKFNNAYGIQAQGFCSIAGVELER